MEILGIVISALLIATAYKMYGNSKELSKPTLDVTQDLKKIQELDVETKKAEESYEDAKKRFMDKYKNNFTN